MDIIKYDKSHYEQTCEVYRRTIRTAFENEGLGHLEDSIREEIDYKIRLLDEWLLDKGEKRRILVAVEGHVLGTISFGPCGKEINECVDASFRAQGELGSLYILPEHQNVGIGSALIQAMLNWLKSDGIKTYALDSGYKHAQKRWIKKFGQPYLIVKDYWGPNGDHMIWQCEV